MFVNKFSPLFHKMRVILMIFLWKTLQPLHAFNFVSRYACTVGT